MLAIINPEFSKIIFPENCIFFPYFKMIVIISKANAKVQNGTATFVKNSNGIPATVNPRIVSTEIKAKQALWQT